jgi:hypothetical protein
MSAGFLGMRIFDSVLKCVFNLVESIFSIDSSALSARMYIQNCVNWRILPFPGHIYMIHGVRFVTLWTRGFCDRFTRCMHGDRLGGKDNWESKTVSNTCNSAAPSSPQLYQ